MGRVVKSFMIKPEWPLQPSTAPVAPHRYTWSRDDEDLDVIYARDGWRAAQAAVPYQPGEVVMLDRGPNGTKALIIDFFLKRSDHTGERRPMFRVMVETAKDTWSKNWEYVWPGTIQRGYLTAGLAPDLAGKL